MARRFFATAETAGRLAAWRAAAPKLLMLDFDGTLSPIAATPGKARLAPGMRRVLGALRRPQGSCVVVISGRALEDLRRRVGVPGLLYVGNHGASGYRAPRISRLWMERARRLARALRPVARRCPGALLESKGPELSLHYRRASRSGIAGLLKAARAAARAFPFAVRGGKKVLEFRVPGWSGKGRAAARLARSLAPGWRRTGLCIYVGDDATDEDAFAALRRLGPRAFGFKVGSGKTAATYRLRNTGEAGRLLRELAAPREPKP